MSDSNDSSSILSDYGGNIRIPNERKRKKKVR